MATKSTMNFDKQVDKAFDMVEKDIRAVMTNVGIAAADSLIGGSPVWSGSYLASHRVKVGEKNVRASGSATDLKKYSTPDQLFPDRLDDAAAQALQGQVKSDLHAQIRAGVNAVPGLKIQIRFWNRSEHADVVEQGGMTTPDQPYHETANYIRTFLRSLVKSIKSSTGSRILYRVKT